MIILVIVQPGTVAFSATKVCLGMQLMFKSVNFMKFIILMLTEHSAQAHNCAHHCYSVSVTHTPWHCMLYDVSAETL